MQRFDPVEAFPGEAVAPEVAVDAGGPVDGPAQVELFDDRSGAGVEVVRHQVAEQLIAQPRGAEAFDVHADRVGHADGVGELHQAAAGQAGSHDVLGDVAGVVAG